MTYFKSIKIINTLIFSVLITTLAHAEEYETGSIAAKRAAEQKAAIAKRAEQRKLEQEAKKAADLQKGTETQEQKTIEEQKDKPVAN